MATVTQLMTTCQSLQGVIVVFLPRKIELPGQETDSYQTKTQSESTEKTERIKLPVRWRR